LLTIYLLTEFEGIGVFGERGNAQKLGLDETIIKN
jgi:hypothetical protein